MSANLPATLARLEAWLAAHVPAIHATLNPGATDAELDALEAHTGLNLPQAFRELYRWHDGQDWSVGGVFGLNFLSLERVQGEWEVWRELEPDFVDETEGHTAHPPGTIREQYISLGWLGFLVDSGGNSVGLDFNPGPNGTPGQVITFGRDEYHKYVLADSLDAFLREYVSRLEAGRVTVESHDGFDAEMWSLALHDAQGEPVNEYGVLAHLFPGFGAAPERPRRKRK